MKMLKRVLTGMMIATMMFASVLSVSAANSKENGVYPSDKNQASYVVADKATAFANVEATVKTQIDKVNKNDFSAMGTDIKAKLDGKKILGATIDLKAVGDHSACVPKHKLTLVVDGLTKSCTDIVVLHYDMGAKAWEVVTPSAVDYDAKTITVELANLSPIAVLAKGVTGGSNGTSPSTGVPSSTWMVWVAVAVVAVGASLVVSQKKSR